MAGAKVDLAIACGPVQVPKFWVPLAANVGRWVRTGIDIGKIIAPNAALTDANRNRAVKGHLEGTSDWLFWFDDDVPTPWEALPVLLSLNRPFCAGLYFLKDDESKPLAYVRNPNGSYSPFEGWKQGVLVEVDAVGMGCTLVHRSVYEKIQATHQVFARPNGSITAIWKERLAPYKELPEWAREMDGYVVGKDGELMLLTRLMPWQPTEHDKRLWPFYAFEHTRTEDLYFCELAEHAGFKPLMDTMIECPHVGLSEWSGNNYRRNMVARWRDEGADDAVCTV